jgi:hypothetical protein
MTGEGINKIKMINVLHFDDGSTSLCSRPGHDQAPAHNRMASNWGEMIRRNITSG